MRELTADELDEASGAGVINDAVTFFGGAGSATGAILTNTVKGAARGGAAGAAVGFAYGVGYSFGSWLYDEVLS